MNRLTLFSNECNNIVLCWNYPLISNFRFCARHLFFQISVLLAWDPHYMFRNCLLSISRRILHVMSDQAQAQKPLRVATFNILAPCYNWISGWWGRCESSKPSLYLPRFRGIIDLISNQTPSLDVVCLQEFWFHDDVMELFYSQLDKKYKIVKLKRTGFKTDGIAILVDQSIK